MWEYSLKYPHTVNFFFFFFRLCHRLKVLGRRRSRPRNGRRRHSWRLDGSRRRRKVRWGLCHRHQQGKDHRLERVIINYVLLFECLKLKKTNKITDYFNLIPVLNSKIKRYGRRHSFTSMWVYVYARWSLMFKAIKVSTFFYLSKPQPHSRGKTKIGIEFKSIYVSYCESFLFWNFKKI